MAGPIMPLFRACIRTGVAHTTFRDKNIFSIQGFAYAIVSSTPLAQKRFIRRQFVPDQNSQGLDLSQNRLRPRICEQPDAIF